MNKYNGKINILHLIEGAKQAKGLTVIIDVFRAFSLECYLYDMKVKGIRPVGSLEDALALGEYYKDKGEECILIGERGGAKCEGFDYGNSPSTIDEQDVKDKMIIHTTSAGTQGIVNATGASEIITGSLVNAKAIAEYIIKKQPDTVSLVCMGNAGISIGLEDELCAQYIKSILEGKEMEDIKNRVEQLQIEGGDHFFDADRQDIYPEKDFWMCTQYNRFPFVIGAYKDEIGYVTGVVRM
jgi:2-phosphosulfolactate phosphatase